MGSGLGLSVAERGELETWARSRRLPAAQVKRARMLLLLDEGLSWNRVSAQTPCSQDFMARWKRRFEQDRLAGLHARHRGRRRSPAAPKLQARILAWTQQRRPADGSSHWSTRKLGKELGVSHMMVARVWAEPGLQPHRVEYYMASDDPDFEAKAVDIIGLYLDPPARAAVFCVDEKTAIQALDRLDPVLPLSPGRAERHGFEYYRHGTLSLYAAFNTRSGKVLGRAVARHTSAEFVAFLTDLVANQPRGKQIHIICDNLSAHKTQAVRDFLADRSNLHIHYTPTYSSWLNQVELWFNRIQRDVIAHGVFTSVADLKRKLMRYIRQYNQAANPIKWIYRDPTHRITTTSTVTGN